MTGYQDRQDDRAKKTIGDFLGMMNRDLAFSPRMLKDETSVQALKKA